MNNCTRRVTGKQLFGDAIVLIKDTAIFVSDFGKLVVFKLKALIESKDSGEKSPPNTTANAQ